MCLLRDIVEVQLWRANRIPFWKECGRGPLQQVFK
jgi:hypothetical protein